RYALTGVVLVSIALVDTSSRGILYTPQTFLTAFIVGGCGATVPTHAPTLPWPFTRNAKNLASSSNASSTVISWSRPCWSERNQPERSSVHFTGRFNSRAACARHT